VFAGVAFGEGTYQRTKDGKTIVWNNDPKPGDAAAWFGDRDRERYATKVGTLTWYTANGAVYVRYFGNMVRGKFNGMVNVHVKGETDHAIFVDGQQTTGWAAGRAPSRRVAQLPALRPAKPAVGAEAPAEGPPTVRKTENAQRPALSATRVAPTRLRNSTPKPVREQAARPTPNSESVPEQAAQHPIEDTPAKELSEQQARPANPAVISKPASAVLPPTNSPARQAGVAEAEPPAEGPGVVQAESALATASSSPGEQPATPSSQSFREQAAQPPMEDTPAVLIQPPEKSVSTPPTSKKSQAEVEDSLQSLARPPSSLLAVPEIAASPEASPRLTKAEVINIANAKARTHGYNRTDYRRPEPQYNAAYKIWSVPYERRVVDGMEEAGEHFSVIVDDKTKGTVLLLRR
jgi:hypothetical protein